MFTYVFVTLSILQSQFIEKGFNKAENSEQNGVLLLFLFTLETRIKTCKWVQEWWPQQKVLGKPANPQSTG